MRLDNHRSAPITPAVEGKPPGWVVACLEAGCGFACDAHALTADDAVQAVAATHAEGRHKMIGRAVDYSTHPLYSKGTV